MAEHTGYEHREQLDRLDGALSDLEARLEDVTRRFRSEVAALEDAMRKRGLV